VPDFRDTKLKTNSIKENHGGDELIRYIVSTFVNVTMYPSTTI
jgi:hypothetical protein